MLQNASNMFFKKETKQNKTTTEKRKNLTQRELNPKPLTCEGMHYPLRHATIAKTIRQINCI